MITVKIDCFLGQGEIDGRFLGRLYTYLVIARHRFINKIHVVYYYSVVSCIQITENPEHTQPLNHNRFVGQQGMVMMVTTELPTDLIDLIESLDARLASSKPQLVLESVSQVFGAETVTTYSLAGRRGGQFFRSPDSAWRMSGHSQHWYRLDARSARVDYRRISQELQKRQPQAFHYSLSQAGLIDVVEGRNLVAVKSHVSNGSGCLRLIEFSNLRSAPSKASEFFISYLAGALTAPFLSTAPAVGNRPEAKTLSPRENQVCSLLAEGASTYDIACSLFISQRTVYFHVNNIYRKLGVHGRHEFMALFLP